MFNISYDSVKMQEYIITFTPKPNLKAKRRPIGIPNK